MKIRHLSRRNYEHMPTIDAQYVAIKKKVAPMWLRLLVVLAIIVVGFFPIAVLIYILLA